MLVLTATLALLLSGQTTACVPQPGGQMVCKTTPATSIEERQSDCEVGGMSALALGCTAGEIKRAKAVKAQREQIGQLIADGRCEEAKSIPLRAGDFDLAERVQKLCTPKP